MSDSTDNLKAIFEKQVGLLHEKSRLGELDSEDIRKLETLTRAWKTFNSTDSKTKGIEDSLDNMSVEELQALLRI
jgi:hypothetical protein